jgi:hypothetical protein
MCPPSDLSLISLTNVFYALFVPGLNPGYP